MQKRIRPALSFAFGAGGKTLGGADDPKLRDWHPGIPPVSKCLFRAQEHQPADLRLDAGPTVGTSCVPTPLVQGRPLTNYIARSCGRFTRNYTSPQIHALYHFTVPARIPNLQPRVSTGQYGLPASQR